MRDFPLKMQMRSQAGYLLQRDAYGGTAVRLRRSHCGGRRLLSRPGCGFSCPIVGEGASLRAFSEAFRFYDILQVLSGGQIEALPFSRAAEELLSKLPKGKRLVDAETLQTGAPQAEPALYRESNGLAPRVTARKLDENLTATLKGRARREGTTVQGALCAALVLAGRKTSSTWRITDSPRDVADQCAGTSRGGRVMRPLSRRRYGSFSAR